MKAEKKASSKAGGANAISRCRRAAGRVAGSASLIAFLAWPGGVLAQTWNVNSNGNWGTASNWLPATVPNGVDASATLGSKITTSRTIRLNIPVTLGTLSFSGSRSYTLNGPQQLTFDTSLGDAALNVTGSGAHRINAATVLNDTLVLNQGSSNTFTYAGPLSGAGGLTKTGSGTLNLIGTNTYAGATLITNGTVGYGTSSAIPAGSAVTLGDGIGAADTARLNINASMASALAFSVTLESDGLLVQGNNRFVRLSSASGTGELRVNSAVGNGFEFTGASDATYSGTITNGISAGSVNPNGGSRILKSGDATQTFSGANTYRGPTFVRQGSLRAASNAALGFVSAGIADATYTDNTGSLELAGGIVTAERFYLNGAGNGGAGALRNVAGNNRLTGVVTLGWTGGGVAAADATIGAEAGTTLTIDGAINGTTALTKVGDGTLVLNGAGTWGGSTTLAAGTLRLGVANALPGASALLFTGGTLDLNGFSRTISPLSGTGAIELGTADVTIDQSVAGTFTGPITGTGSLTKTGAETLTLIGTNTYSGGTTVSAGTLRGDATSLQGDIANNAAVVFDQAIAGAFGGIMSGTGSLTKTGLGTLSLTAASTYSGGTFVDEGTLSVDGSVSGPLVVQADATLAGRGTVGDVQVLAAGTIAPGNSIGTLTLASLDQAGIYALEYRAPPSGSFAFIPSGTGQSIRGRNTLLDPGLAVTDQDADLIHVTGAATLAAGSTVSLSRLGSDLSFTDAFNAPGNTNRELRYLILRADGGVTGQYVALSESGSQLEYLDNGGAPGLEDVWLVLRGPDVPIITSAAPAPYALPLPSDRPACDLASLAAGQQRCFFVQGTVGQFDLDADGAIAGTDTDAWDGMVGAGAQVADGLWLGFALGHQDGDADLSDGSGSADYTRLSGNLWGNWQSGAFEVRGWLGVGTYDVASARQTASGAIAAADYDGTSSYLALEARRWHEVRPGFALTPLLGLAAARLETDPYTETGGGIENFSADDQSRSSLRSLIGIEGRWRPEGTPVPVVLEASLGWSHEFGDTTTDLSGTYQGDITSTTLSSVSPSAPRNEIAATIGATFALDARNTLRLDYGLGYGDNVLNQAATARWTLAF